FGLDLFQGSARLLCRRLAASDPFGALTDILLGITGAFAARWFMDVLRQIGGNFESDSWVFILCGAALLPWGFHSFYRRQDRFDQSQRSRVSRQDSQLSRQKMAGPQADSRKTRAPAA